MLVEFSVKNYRSIYDKITFSLEAASKNEHDEHVIEKSRQRILKTSVIYGANASGKSNLLKALVFMKDMVLNSSKESQFGEEIKSEPFLLNTQGMDEPTEMEAVFLINDALYRYGFAFNSKEISNEWLFVRSTKPRSWEIKQFERENNRINSIHRNFKEGKERIKELLKENTLFLSLLSQFNGEISSQVVKCFLDTNIWNIEAYMPMHTSILIKNKLVPREWISEFLIKADVGIKGFKINEEEIGSNSVKALFSNQIIVKSGASRFINLLIQTEHEFYDDKDHVNRSVWFDLGTQESEGTKKFFSLAGLLYHTLKNGSRLFIDEIENSLHPILCEIIIKLFQDKDTNPLGAQLVLTTHNTSLLDKSHVRRDEIWFMEKNTHNSSDLYSLVEYKLPSNKVRKDASYSKDYIRGKYGALPYVKYSDFADLFKRS